MTDLDDFIANFQRRSLQDALCDATADWWHRRAAEWDAVPARPGDYVGQSTPEQRKQRRREAADRAALCRYRAGLALVERWPEVDALDERWTA